jgi:multiple sugar transport system permease protein
MLIPFSTIMLRGFFENIPDTLEEAAMIDGCSRLGALFRVLVPVMLPGIAATFIFAFVSCWNELFLSVTFMNSDENKTIPTALNGFITSYNIDWGPMSAAAVRPSSRRCWCSHSLASHRPRTHSGACQGLVVYNELIVRGARTA